MWRDSSVILEGKGQQVCFREFFLKTKTGQRKYIVGESGAKSNGGEL